MTRDATAENIKGDFGDVVYDFQGLKTRLFRQADQFFMETIDPGWALMRAKLGDRKRWYDLPEEVDGGP